MLGCALRTVQGWERDGRMPHGPVLRNLAATLKVDIGYLTGETDDTSSVRSADAPYRADDQFTIQLRAVLSNFNNAELLEKARVALQDQNTLETKRAVQAKPFIDELARRDSNSAAPSGAVKLLAKAAGEDTAR